MNIVVLGATGATGRLVVEQALMRGHYVTAYVRDPSVLKSRSGLTIHTGQLDDAASLQVALAGADAVLCCLGTHQMRHVRLMQKSLPLIISAMQAAQVSRLILLSAYGIGDTAQTAGLLARIAYATLVKSVYADKVKSEALLSQSDLAWTGIYPVILTNAPIIKTVEVRSLDQVQQVKGLPKIPRANVAEAMLDAAENSATIGQRLLITPSGTVW